MRANLEISEILMPSKASVGFSKNFKNLKEEFMELRRDFNTTPSLPSIHTPFEDEDFQIERIEQEDEDMYYYNDSHLEFGLLSVSPSDFTHVNF